MTFTPGLRPIIPETRKSKKNGLASALRLAGRSIEAGRPIDVAALSALIAPWSEKRPMDGVRLQAFLDAAQADAAREDRNSAIKHFREAIEFVNIRDKRAA